MNWRRGAWVAWMVVTVLWFAAIGAVAAVHFSRAMRWEFDLEVPNRLIDVPLQEWSDTDLVLAWCMTYVHIYEPWVARAVVPPAMLLAVGFLFRRALRRVLHWRH